MHDDIPFDNNDNNRTLYLDILLDVVKNWINSKEHTVFVSFPENAKERIEKQVDFFDKEGITRHE
jgi:hypothetical protein